MDVSILPVATRALVEACGRMGLDVDALVSRAGLDRARLDDPDARIPADRADAVWREAHLAARDATLALRAAEQTPFGAFRVLDYLGVSGATVGEGLRRVAAYFPLVDPRGSLSIEEFARGAMAMVFRGAGGASVPPEAQEYTLAILLSRVRHLWHSSEPSIGVRFAFPRPAHALEQVRALGIEPVYDAPAAAIVLARDLWNAPAPGRDPRLFAALDEHASGLLSRTRSGADVAHRARAAIAEDLPGCEPSLAKAARRLGVSPRTLQRRLAAEGTTFAMEVDRVRRRRAEGFLRTPDVSVAEVSWLLGFAEQSAFTRAFRRWTGKAPTEWRCAVAGRFGPRRTPR